MVPTSRLRWLQKRMANQPAGKLMNCVKDQIICRMKKSQRIVVSLMVHTKLLVKLAHQILVGILITFPYQEPNIVTVLTVVTKKRLLFLLVVNHIIFVPWSRYGNQNWMLIFNFSMYAHNILFKPIKTN